MQQLYKLITWKQRLIRKLSGRKDFLSS